MKMKFVILAGDYWTRISEALQYKSKPRVELGEKQILWHITKWYSSYEYDELIILAGYKQYVFKDYFTDYYFHNSDVTFVLANNYMTVHKNFFEKWNVTIVDTTFNTIMWGRVKSMEVKNNGK